MRKGMVSIFEAERGWVESLTSGICHSVGVLGQGFV